MAFSCPTGKNTKKLSQYSKIWGKSRLTEAGALVYIVRNH